MSSSKPSDSPATGRVSRTPSEASSPTRGPPTLEQTHKNAQSPNQRVTTMDSPTCEKFWGASPPRSMNRLFSVPLLILFLMGLILPEFRRGYRAATSDISEDINDPFVFSGQFQRKVYNIPSDSESPDDPTLEALAIQDEEKSVAGSDANVIADKATILAVEKNEKKTAPKSAEVPTTRNEEVKQKNKSNEETQQRDEAKGQNNKSFDNVTPAPISTSPKKGAERNVKKEGEGSHSTPTALKKEEPKKKSLRKSYSDNKDKAPRNDTAPSLNNATSPEHPKHKKNEKKEKKNDKQMLLDSKTSAPAVDDKPKQEKAPADETINKHDANLVHFANVTLMDWLPWEETSRTTLKDFPSTIPKTCSIGTISNGGALKPFTNCGAGGLDAYKRVQQATLDMIGEDGVCDVCEMVDLAHKHNLTIAFLGDSLMSQNRQGLICELARRNYQVNLRESQSMLNNECNGMRCLTYRYTYDISSPTLDNNVTFIYFKQFRPRDDWAVQALPALLASQPDVLMFNFGLHYKFSERWKYINSMRVAMKAFAQVRDDVPLLAFRETSAQHFQSPWGEYGFDYDGDGCGPLGPRNSTNPFGWRDTELQEQAVKHNFTVIEADPSSKTPMPPLQDGARELVWIPFRNFTGLFHDLHPGECTHYCHTPFLWYPQWRSLRLAMERRWGASKDKTAS